MNSIVASEMEPSVGLQEVVPGVGLHEVEASAGLKQVNVSMCLAERTIEIGLQSDAGHFTDFSGKLDQNGADYAELDRLLGKYSQGAQNYSLNLSDLKDGNGNVLVPVKDRTTGTIDDAATFERDMKTLREIAKRAVGVKGWHWKEFRVGYRAPLGEQRAFRTDQCILLRDNLDFDTNHLRDWLEALNKEEYTPDPNIKDSAAQETKKKEWEDDRQTRIIRAVKGYYMAIAMMSATQTAVQEQIKQLEKEAKAGSVKPNIGAEIERLRKLSATLPVGEIPSEKEELLAAGKNGQISKRAAVLYAATHLHYGDTMPDVKAMHAEATAFIDSFSKPSGDCSGFLSYVSPFAKFSPENQELVADFTNSLVECASNTPEGNRSQLDQIRGSLRAKDLSDSSPLFYVQSIGAMVEADQKKIADAHSRTAYAIAFGNDSPIRHATFRAAQCVSEAFADTPNPTPAEMRDMDAVIEYYGAVKVHS